MIQVEHLSKVYGKGENEVVALNDVSFSVKKGEFVAIIGPSGSGKSTLLHILGGVDRPTKGKVYFDGVDVYQQKEDQLAIFCTDPQMLDQKSNDWRSIFLWLNIVLNLKRK